jgi:hypothetical protein
MPAPGSEAVMLSGTPAKSDRGVGGSRKRSLLESLARIREAAHFAAAIGLLACFGGGELWAQAPPQKLIVHRSTRAIPHRFIVHPNEATLAINQTQHFEVTDAQGKPVSVHWNVSGIGCSGMDCGTIDDQGNYRTPSSLPKPRVVTVEGVLASDPNYSVLTQVWIDDSATAGVSGIPREVAAANTQPFAAAEIGRQNLAGKAESMPLPNVVAAAPAVARQLASDAELPPLPAVVVAPPVIGRQNLAGKAESMPLPNVVAAAPAVGQQSLARTVELATPSVVSAAPAVGRQNLSAKAVLLPAPTVIAPAPEVGQQSLALSVGLATPSVVSAAPAVGRQNLSAKAELLPPPTVIAPAPEVGQQSLALSVGLATPSVVAAAPAVGRKNLVRKTESLPPPTVIAPAPEVGQQSLALSVGLATPSVVAAAPAVGGKNLASKTEPLPRQTVIAPAPSVATQSLARSTDLTPQPTIVATLGPIPPKIPIGKTQSLVAPAVGKQSVAGGGVLSPMSDVAPAVPGGTVASTEHASVVTYRDGQLTIDAENVTLAAVLALIAEKTGAVIEVPPGSGQERIFEHTGPAPPNDVLERLLNGSPFNFIIVNSPENPNLPAQVLLSLHVPETDAPPTVAVVPPTPSLSPPLWTPPPVPPTAAVLAVPVDTPPKEPLSPEELGEMMKERARQLREQIQKQQ